MTFETVLITGAAGFIGRHVAVEYAKRGMRVIGMGRGDWADWKQYGFSEWHQCEVTLDSLITYAGSPDVIVHCAGGSSVGLSVEKPYQDFIQTVNTMAQILEFMRLHAPLAKLVYPSSAAVYGEVAQLPIAENAASHPVSPYGVYKQLAENLCQLYARQYKIAVVIVRLFSIYGEGLRKQLLWDACRKISQNDTSFFGTGNEIRDWLHVNDAASLIVLATDHASTMCPIVNGGAGIATSVKEIITELLSNFNSAEKPIFSGISRIGDPIGYQADIAMARSWGWQPAVPLNNGLHEYVAWFKRSAP
jgi:UDP-glucose 4-epimerase